jgi:exodeoxyribonuclease VII large subunit
MQAFNFVRDLHAEDPIDALVLIRGGGARQGLLNLIKYSVLEQICTFPVPVITGLGHADDILLIEEVSCLRRDTPSKAIHYILNTIVNRAALTIKNWHVILTESHKQLLRQKHAVKVCMLSIKDSSQGLIYRMLQRLQDFKNYIYRQTTSQWQQLQIQLRNYQQQIFRSQLQLQREQHNLEQIVVNIKQQTRWLLQNCQQQIQSNFELIKAYDPDRVLERGYSLTLSTQGKVLRTKKLAAEQQEFIVKFYDGELPVIPKDKTKGAK